MRQSATLFEQLAGEDLLHEDLECNPSATVFDQPASVDLLPDELDDSARTRCRVLFLKVGPNATVISQLAGQDLSSHLHEGHLHEDLESETECYCLRAACRRASSSLRSVCLRVHEVQSTLSGESDPMRL